MQKGLEINFYDLARHILKKWPVLLVIAILAGAAANVYGYHREAVSAEKERAELENYAASLGTTVENLPEHMTAELADLRAELTEEEATFVEAVAKLYMYRMWASEKINEEMDIGTPDANDLEIVQTLYYANESVQSGTNVMTSAQKSYYNVLTRELSGTDMSATEKNITVPGLLQPKWLVIGIVLGLLLGTCMIAFAYMMSGKLRTAKDMEEAYGIPVLATVPQNSETDLTSVSKGLKRLLDEKKIDSLALCTVETPQAENICRKLADALKQEQVQVLSASRKTDAFAGSVSMAGAVLFVEHIGNSRYRDIENYAADCRNYQVPAAGCVVIE